MLSSFGPSVRTVFRSRWRALWWSAGVLLTAYCTVPSAEDTAADQPQAPPAPEQHVNPWAKDGAKK
jgi:hypothetical protein